MAPNAVVIQPLEQPTATVASADREQRRDMGIGKHRVDVRRPLIVGAGGESVPRFQMSGDLDAISQPFEVADASFDDFVSGGRAGGGDQTDDIPAAQTGGRTRGHDEGWSGGRLGSAGGGLRAWTGSGLAPDRVWSEAFGSYRGGLHTDPLTFSAPGCQ